MQRAKPTQPSLFLFRRQARGSRPAPQHPAARYAEGKRKRHRCEPSAARNERLQTGRSGPRELQATAVAGIDRATSSHAPQRASLHSIHPHDGEQAEERAEQLQEAGLPIGRVAAVTQAAGDSKIATGRTPPAARTGGKQRKGSGYTSAAPSSSV